MYDVWCVPDLPATLSCLQPFGMSHASGASEKPATLICLQPFGMSDAWGASDLPATLVCLQPLGTVWQLANAFLERVLSK